MSYDKLYEFYEFNPERNRKYYAVYPIDEGGFGYVWSGVSDVGLNVAIKIIKPTSDFTRDFLGWINEQDIYLKCLEHQHIVTTFDQFYSSNGHLVIVMERAGGSLENLLSKGHSFSPLMVCSIGTQILSALHHIHSLGVIHRDVTLKNILWFSSGSVKLSDFGISRQGVSAQEIARTFIGKWSAIPPELAFLGYSNHQSDIYQMGLILLMLLTGDHPIPKDTTPEVIGEMIRTGVPRQKAESLVPKYGNLAQIISIMLRRHTEYRYKTALEAWDDLYREYQTSQYFKAVLEEFKKQAPPELPPWYGLGKP